MIPIGHLLSAKGPPQPIQFPFLVLDAHLQAFQATQQFRLGLPGFDQLHGDAAHSTVLPVGPPDCHRFYLCFYLCFSICFFDLPQPLACALPYRRWVLTIQKTFAYLQDLDGRERLRSLLGMI